MNEQQEDAANMRAGCLGLSVLVFVVGSIVWILVAGIVDWWNTLVAILLFAILFLGVGAFGRRVLGE